MINQGIETEEIIACCEAGKLPALKKPETQQPLVNIVEKAGHSVMVAQVLVEEAYREAKYGKPRPPSCVMKFCSLSPDFVLEFPLSRAEFFCLDHFVAFKILKGTFFWYYLAYIFELDLSPHMVH